MIDEHECFNLLAVHGGYSQWSNFTECSVTCGSGFQSRTRTCTNPLPCCGGRNCDRLGPNVQTQECDACPCGTEVMLFLLKIVTSSLEGVVNSQLKLHQQLTAPAFGS